MSGNINEAAHDETAAAGDAASRSSAEAAALTAGSTPPEQQLHSGSASRLSPKVKGGIIALLAASVPLVSVGAFALAGGFDEQGGSSAQSSSQEAQTTEQGNGNEGQRRGRSQRRIGNAFEGRIRFIRAERRIGFRCWAKHRFGFGR